VEDLQLAEFARRLASRGLRFLVRGVFRAVEAFTRQIEA